MGRLHAVLPKPKVGTDDVLPLCALLPKPPLNRLLGASPAGLLMLLPPNRLVDGAPDVAPPPPNMAPGLLAGVFDAPPPKGFDAPVFDPPPKMLLPPVLAGVLVAPPKRDGVAPPDVLFAPPNRGLFGVLPLLLGCPNPKLAMLRGFTVLMGVCGVVDVARRAVYADEERLPEEVVATRRECRVASAGAEIRVNKNRQIQADNRQSRRVSVATKS